MLLFKAKFILDESKNQHSCCSTLDGELVCALNYKELKS